VQASVEQLDTSVEAVAGTLGALLKHLIASTTRDFFSALESAGISITQLKCLGLLCDAVEPMAFASLSAEIGLSAPAVSRAVDGLVQRGEVKRTEDPRDRRAKLLTVSGRGRRTFERLIEIRFAGVRRFVETLSEDEREALAEAIGPPVGRLNA
jgi:DNA-binding MarR family transcriptional regulator